MAYLFGGNLLRLLQKAREPEAGALTAQILLQAGQDEDRSRLVERGGGFVLRG